MVWSCITATIYFQMSYIFPCLSARVSIGGPGLPLHTVRLLISVTFLMVDVLAGNPIRTSSAGVVALLRCLPSTSTCRLSVPSMTVWVNCVQVDLSCWILFCNTSFFPYHFVPTTHWGVLGSTSRIGLLCTYVYLLLCYTCKMYLLLFLFYSSSFRFPSNCSF